MPTAAPAPTRIPGYDLDAPTEASTLAALERVFGNDRARALWTEACHAAGHQAGRVSSMDALTRVASSLASQGGAAATVARSIAIRMRTHAQLAARRATPASGDGR